ncbi:hypothetical protein Tco_0506001 [Tanacetum coccineum]
MTSFDYRLNPIYAIKECSSCGSLYTSNCGCSKGSLEDKILVPIPDSSQRSFKIEKFCLDCGDPIHGFHCQGCALIQKTFEEVLQDFQDTSESSDDNTNVVNAPREPIVVNQDPGENSSPSPPHIDHCCHECGDSLDESLSTMHLCGCNEYEWSLFYCKVGNGTQINVSIPYSSNDSPRPVFKSKRLINFPNFSEFFSQQYLCCENCGGPHETFQCQPMNEDYYHEQSSCYDSNSFGFDQFQPPQYTVNHQIVSSQNDLLNSQNKLMEQRQPYLIGYQVIQIEGRENGIAEEQAAKDRSWKIPICYDDDEDNTIAITPVSPIEEPDNSLSMGDEHLDTIPETESDEFIKSSVENLVPIPTFKEHSETIIDYNDDSTSSDDDSYENIEYVDASPPDVEIVSLEVVEIVDPEIDSLRDNPTPSSEVVIKSTSTFPNLFLEETNTFDNSIPESETFRFNLEEIIEKSSGSTTTHVDFSQYDSFIFDLSNDQFPPADRSDLNHEEFADELTHIMSLPLPNYN